MRLSVARATHLVVALCLPAPIIASRLLWSPVVLPSFQPCRRYCHTHHHHRRTGNAIGLLHGRGRGGGGGDGSSVSRGKKKGDLPEKVCVVCGRPFTWRKKWEKVWDEVKYCSDRCRNSRNSGKRDEDPTMTGSGEGSLRGDRYASRRGFLGGAGGLAASLIASSCIPPAPTSAAPLRPSANGVVIERVLQDVDWPIDPPFSREDFRRLDESDDSAFYDSPKLVQHVDDAAVGAMRRWYSRELEDLAQGMYGESSRSLDILDLGSSWVSHLPPRYSEGHSSRVAGLGMNADELKQNAALTEWRVQDLNRQPKLPYADASFDAVLCSLSIDYLTKPVTVTREVARVLRPGGIFAVMFSNRLFITKAVGLWTGAADEDHVYTVGAYLHYGGETSGLLSAPKALDISPSRTRGDPLYVVYAKRTDKQ